MRKVLIPLFLIILFLSCNSNPQKMTEVPMPELKSVTGAAYNAKGGAIVYANEGQVYYIQNLMAWPEEILEKQVLVNGELLIVHHGHNSAPNTDGIYKQSMAGDQRILRNAVWKLLE